jgi:hypothetical protein
MANNTRVKTPHGIVVIYNYKERFGSSYLDTTDGQEFDIDQIILNSGSLKSIQIQKGKADPGGSFELRLAPYKNWTTAITPGSWCVIMMSNYHIDDTAKHGGGTVNSKTFKMLGRIESVRGTVNTDQRTGAVAKEYIVTGSDWGAMFNNSLYVDPLDRDPSQTAMGMAQRFGYNDYLKQALNWKSELKTKDLLKKNPTSSDSNTNYVLEKGADQARIDAVKQETNTLIEANKNKPTPPPSVAPSGGSTTIPDATFNVDTILSLWGSSGGKNKTKDNLYVASLTNDKLLGDAQQQFKIPKELAKYMKFGEDSVNVTDILKQYSGVLTGQDTYSNRDPSIGLIDFESIFGEHSMWEVLNNNINNLTSELLTDVRFDGNKPTLALYNRVRPFVVDKERMKSDGYYIGDKQKPIKAEALETMISEFKNVKCIDINYNDVILSSYGTNWRDRVNFVEVSISRSLLFGEVYSTSLKLDSQFYDKRSIARDGLRSRKVTTAYVPKVGGFADPIASSAYKYLLKEFYFNNHTMLNGTLSLTGQDAYIQVGDNIMVDAKVLDINNNFNSNQLSRSTTYLLAHVESISHNVSYTGDFRVFATSINFVRGILVDKNKQPIDKQNFAAVDQDANKITTSEEHNRYISSSSSPADPDREKL